MADRDLQFGYWLVSSRPMLRRLAFVLLVAVAALFMTIAFIIGTRYLSGMRAADQTIVDLAQNRVPAPSTFPNLRPPQLTVERATLLQDIKKSYNAAAIVTNPSKQWALVTGTYEWRLDGRQIAVGTTTLLPSEQRSLTAFALVLPSGTVPSAKFELVFTDRVWKRITGARQLPDVRFELTKTKYSILSNLPQHQLSTVTAVLTNASIETFPQVELTALLMNGNGIIGVGQLQLNDVQGLSTRDVELRFNQALNVTSVILKAGVDVFAAERVT